VLLTLHPLVAVCSFSVNMTSSNSNATDSTEHNANNVEEKYDYLLASGDERVESVYQTRQPTSVVHSKEWRPTSSRFAGVRYPGSSPVIEVGEDIAGQQDVDFKTGEDYLDAAVDSAAVASKPNVGRLTSAPRPLASTVVYTTPILNFPVTFATFSAHRDIFVFVPYEYSCLLTY